MELPGVWVAAGDQLPAPNAGDRHHLAFFRSLVFASPTAVLVPMLIASSLGLVALFERLRVLERHGVRCRGCGYDLRGQHAPSCPECGRALDEQEQALLARENPEHAVTDRRLGGTARRLITIALIFLLASTALVHGILLYSRMSRQTLTSQTSAMLEAVLIYDLHHGLTADTHAAEFTETADSGARVFLGYHSDTPPEGITLGALTIPAFRDANDANRALAVRTAGAALPANLIAHRVGDFVFTYHGIDLSSADPGLWLLVHSPDPAFNTVPVGDDELAVGCANGAVHIITANAFPAELQAQNVRRADAGLPPLPDPRKVAPVWTGDAQP